MKITEPEFSEMRRRAEEESEEDTQKMAAVPPFQGIKRAEPIEKDPDTLKNSLFQRIEEGPVTMSKEAPGENVWPEQDDEESLVAMPEPTPDELTTPVAASSSLEEHAIMSGESSPEQSTRPATRKNVIPSRRATFENSNRMQSSVKRNAWSAENAQSAEPVQPAKPQAAPVTPVVPVVENTQKHREASRDAADVPTNVSLPAISLDASANKLETPINWQAAPVLPVSWQMTPAMPESWQAEQGTPTLAELEPAWGKTPVPSEIESAGPNRGERETLDTDDEHIRQTAAMETRKMAALSTPAPTEHAGLSELPKTPAPLALTNLPKTPIPAVRESVSEQATTPLPLTPLPLTPPLKPLPAHREILTRGRAAFLVLLLAILVINVSATGFSQFFGPQGWGSAFNSSNNSGQSLLNQLKTPTPGAKGQPTAAPLTPKQIVDKLLANMTLDEKLGQMMMVQFTGPEYSLQLSAMISQYKIGSVLVFAANGNIVSKTQLKGLISQMQQNAFLPLTVSIDQEGGTVDRLINLDGAQPAAATIGATGNPQVAYQQGIKDAQDLSSYGFNLNLAPVVDVTNVYNKQMYDRTYGNNPTIVTQMAGSYLQGLQKSGKVVGTLKHFPGLGDVSVDPHDRPPDLIRSLNDLNTIDWAPYSALIKQGDVYTIMVTHEYVKALDSSEPSSLSPQVIGVLRNQMHFQGVIMTDSLTMDSIHNYYSYGQAAAKAIEAGDDILMGATSPNDVAQMIDGIKQGISSGAITQQQIDDSVERILLLKYQMGLLNING